MPYQNLLSKGQQTFFSSSLHVKFDEAWKPPFIVYLFCMKAV
jgi:hypothetical protein